MSRALDVVTLTGEEYDDLMECKEMVASLLAQLSAAKDRIAELTPVAGMDWRETMQRMLTRMEETDRWPAICDKARAVLSLANDATREPAAYLWGGEPIVHEGQPLGELSSAGWSPKAGACVGLGYARGEAALREHHGTSMQVESWGVPVAVKAYERLP